MSNVSLSVYPCTDSPPAVHITFCWTLVKYSLVFPPSVLILHRAHRRWLPRRSSRSASHLDILTYHVAAMELIGAGGGVSLTCGIYVEVKALQLFGVFWGIFCFPGEVLIHCFTCVDRYLAVVHPIAYLESRQNSGIRKRNICVLFIWLCCAGFVIIQALCVRVFPAIPLMGLLTIALILVSFCSFSVLKVLVRPGPGDVVNDRVDQSKRKAFNTIAAILVTLFVSFAGFTVCMAFTMSPLTDYDLRCMIFTSGFWANIPSSLVLPMLFLKRSSNLKFRLPRF